MQNIFFYATDVGEIGFGDNGKALTRVYFRREAAGPAAATRETALTRLAAQQLAEYLAGRRRTFALPLEPAGTAFQLRVWQALQAIPYGETRSYREVAAQLGQAQACRAVGMANHRNPLPIFIPCHRVIGADGRLAGYAGGLELKRRLLDLEAAVIRGGRGEERD